LPAAAAEIPGAPKAVCSLAGSAMALCFPGKCAANLMGLLPLARLCKDSANTSSALTKRRERRATFYVGLSRLSFCAIPYGHCFSGGKFLRYRPTRTILL